MKYCSFVAMWNEINPHTPAGVFHMAKPYFTHEVHFTNPARDLFRWKKHLLSQVLFYGSPCWARTSTRLRSLRHPICPSQSSGQMASFPCGHPPASCKHARETSQIMMSRQSKPNKKKPKQKPPDWVVFVLAPPAGLEPATSWLTVMRSTDWAKEE